ncbi:hypothetical protein EG328_003710 [Venturia inaequalis]|uniref:Uncharacterized protein n=2 Tax=Venturia inaequalis TaxID=5025 RepID=A0A8H3USU8_VENIN|nr:hypothetical protein EG328_003710 [Venturia inaequalis]
MNGHRGMVPGLVKGHTICVRHWKVTELEPTPSIHPQTTTTEREHNVRRSIDSKRPPPFGGFKNGMNPAHTQRGVKGMETSQGNPTQAAQPNARIVYIIGTKD